MKYVFGLAVVGLLVILVWFTGQSGSENSINNTVTFYCPDNAVAVVTYIPNSDKALLQVASDEYNLTSTPAASSVRYVSDSGVSFWEHQSEATIMFPDRDEPMICQTEKISDDSSAYATIDDVITVTAPVIGTAVDNPIHLTGKARGYWFFEATAPVVVTNWDGLIIGEGYITADGDWMTEEYVPFSGSVTYTLPANSYSATGTIIFKKANPSDLPENDAALEMSVQLTPDTATGTPPIADDVSGQTSLIACTEEQKTAEFCTQEYVPVCGLQEVQCITEPCDPVPQTYGNACTACATDGVASYTQGECSV